MSHYSYPLNDERERLLDKIESQTDANTQAKAIDKALRHYLEDMKNRKQHCNKFEPEKLKLLNTSEMKVAYYPRVK